MEKKRAGREVWAKRVERWVDSGLTAKEFGAEVGLSPRTLTYWKWRLKKEAKASKPRRSAAKPRKTSPRKRRSAPQKPQFVELAPQPNSLANSPVELVLPSGMVVRVPVGFDAETVSRLVAVLEAKA